MTIKLNKKLRRKIRDCVMSGLATAFVGRLRRPLLTMSASTILGITIIAPNAALAFGPPPPPPSSGGAPPAPALGGPPPAPLGELTAQLLPPAIQLARMDPSLANAANVAARLT